MSILSARTLSHGRRMSRQAQHRQRVSLPHLSLFKSSNSTDSRYFQPGLQALASLPLQKIQHLRIPARIQPPQNARMQLLPAQQLLLQRRRMSLPTHRPRIQTPPVPTLRPRLLSPRSQLLKEARPERDLSVFPGWVLLGGESV